MFNLILGGERSYSTFDIVGKITEFVSSLLYTIVWILYILLNTVEQVIYFLFGIDVENSFFSDNLFTILFKVNLNNGNYVNIKKNFGELFNTSFFHFILAMIVMSIILYIIMLFYSFIKGKMSDNSFKLERKMIINSPKTIVKMITVPVATLLLVIGFSFLVGKSYSFLKKSVSPSSDTLTYSIFQNNFSNIKLKSGISINTLFEDEKIEKMTFNYVDEWINKNKDTNTFGDYDYPMDFTKFKFSYILSTVTALAFGYGLVLTAFKAVQRLSKILMYIGLAPYVILQENLDKGAKYQNWKKSIIESIITLVSTLFTFLITFILINLSHSGIEKLQFKNLDNTILDFIKLLMKAIIVVVLGYTMPSLASKIDSIITSGIGGEDSNITGGENDTNVKGGNIMSKFTPVGRVFSKLKNKAGTKIKDRIKKAKQNRLKRLKKKASIRKKIPKDRIQKSLIKKGMKARMVMARNKARFIKDKVLHGKLGSKRRAKYETNKAVKEKKKAQVRKDALIALEKKSKKTNLNEKDRAKLDKQVKKQKERVSKAFIKIADSKKEYDRQRKEQNKINEKKTSRLKAKIRKGNFLDN